MSNCTFTPDFGQIQKDDVQNMKKSNSIKVPKPYNEIKLVFEILIASLYYIDRLVRVGNTYNTYISEHCCMLYVCD